MATKKYTLHLKGYVGGWDFDADYVDYILDKNADKRVDVLIDSLGGSVQTALSIAAAFKRHGNVYVHFVGMNASAATIASLGAKHISIDANAMYLVHKCSVTFFEWAQMNADQLADLSKTIKKQKEDLDKFDLNVASMYAGKCKKETKDLLDLMKKGGWMTAQDARDWGFVDEITDLAEDAAPEDLTQTLAASMQAAGIPLPNMTPAPEDSNLLTKLSNLFTSLFKNINKNNIDMANEKDVNETPAPAVDTAEPEVDDATKSQLEAKDAEIAKLKAEIADLKKAPAEDTTTVVDTGKEELNPTNDFYDNLKKANELYDQIK